jgi:hypothetical protein
VRRNISALWHGSHTDDNADKTERKRRSTLDLRGPAMAGSNLNSGSGHGRDSLSLQGESFMSVRKLAMVAALGLSMASAPVLAQSAPIERAGAEMVQASAQDDDDDGGYGSTTTTYIIAFFVVLVIGLGIYFAIDDEGDDRVTP